MKSMFNWLINLFKHQDCQSVSSERSRRVRDLSETNEACKHDFAPWQISTCQNTTSGAILLVQICVCRKCMYSQIDRQEV